MSSGPGLQIDAQILSHERRLDNHNNRLMAIESRWAAPTHDPTVITETDVKSAAREIIACMPDMDFGGSIEAIIRKLVDLD